MTSVLRNRLASRTAVVLLLLFFLTACNRLVVIPIQEAPAFKMPDVSVFEEGDIVLTFSSTPTSWFLSFLGSDNPQALVEPYTHVEMVFVNEQGIKMLGGFSNKVMHQPLKVRIPNFHKLVVLRANKSYEERKKLADKMAEISSNTAYRQAGFDYSFRDVPGRKDKFYCMGLLNEVYRQTGQPTPFPHYPLKGNLLLVHIEELLGQDINSGPRVQDIFKNPDYRVVLKWENNQDIYRDHWLAEHVARYAYSLYTQGWQLKQSKEMSLSLAFFFTKDDEYVQSLKRTIRTFENFEEEVDIDWKKLKIAGKLNGMNEGEKEVLLEDIAQKYRDRFFIYASTTALTQQ